MSKRNLIIKYPWYWEVALVIIVCWALWGLSVLFLDDVNQGSPQVGTAIGTQNVYASGLSDETQELVEGLRWKHSAFILVDEDTMYYRPEEYKWTSLWVEDDKLFIETQDGVWFIEMERKEE